MFFLLYHHKISHPLFAITIHLLSIRHKNDRYVKYDAMLLFAFELFQPAINQWVICRFYDNFMSCNLQEIVDETFINN